MLVNVKTILLNVWHREAIKSALAMASACVENVNASRIRANTQEGTAKTAFHVLLKGKPRLKTIVYYECKKLFFNQYLTMFGIYTIEPCSRLHSSSKCNQVGAV